MILAGHTKPIPLGDLSRFTYTAHTTRQAWLAGRMNCVGASDSAGLLGEGYADQNELTIWKSKVHGDPDDEVDKSLTIGRILEPALREIFTLENGLPCESPGEFRIYRHPLLHWMGATLDGLTEHPDYGICSVELKNVDRFLQSQWSDDQQPVKFQVQCQHQMAVLGTSHAFLLGLIGGNKPVVCVLERDDEFIASLIDHLKTFWSKVERKEMPEIDGSEATKRALGQIYKEDEGESVCLPAEAAEWAEKLQQSKDDIKNGEERELQYGNMIRAAIGEASFGDIPGHGRFSWKTQSRAGHYVRPSTFRVLRKCNAKSKK